LIRLARDRVVRRRDPAIPIWPSFPDGVRPCRAADFREGRAFAARTGQRVTTVKRVQREVRKLEGFDIVMRYAGGERRNVRDDRKRIPSYRGKYERKARERFTVADWKRTRFARHYPGFEVDVLDAKGRVADGRVRLSNLRSRYG